MMLIVLGNTLQVDDPENPADSLRSLPIGEDSKGNRYYYFSANSEDCRLYREDPPGKKRANKKQKVSKDEAAWETVCTTLEEMTEFVESLAATRNKAERALHALLSSDILPKCVETADARRKAEAKAAEKESQPIKRSNRLLV